MKKLYIYSIMLFALVIVSCNNKESLQTYLVDSQDKKGFISLDIPASVVQLTSDSTSEEDKKAYESIRKINVTGLPYTNTDNATYEAEKKKIKDILSKSSYKKLMNFKKDGMNAAIYYSGETDAIDEIVALGYGKKLGVGIARILGKDMNPAKIMDMMQKAKINTDNVNIDQFKMIFKDK